MSCVFQERVDGLRASASDGKRNIAALTERVQTLQSELSQSQLRRSELETELHNTQEVSERLHTWVLSLRRNVALNVNVPNATHFYVKKNRM